MLVLVVNITARGQRRGVVNTQDDCRNCHYGGERFKEGSTGALVGVQLFCVISRNDCNEYVECMAYRPRTPGEPLIYFDKWLKRMRRKEE